MSHFPPPIASINHVAPAPRRVRGIFAGEAVFDTLRALYVWEIPPYPQYYVPLVDVRSELLAAGGEPSPTPRGDARKYALSVGDRIREEAASVIDVSPIAGLSETVRFDWDALDAWFEEDEEVFVHPRSPYTRVDALRSRRTVRVERNGVVLAESAAAVMVFETGLPTRYYFDPRDVRFEHLAASQTRTACPYKGRTTGYWSVRVNGRLHPDLAWMYSFPTAALIPIAGLVSFLNERVDIFIDGEPQSRPITRLGG